MAARGEQLSHYKQCPSVQAVLYVSHRRPEITVVARAGTGWAERVYRAGEWLARSSPELELSVAEVYAGFELDGE